MSYMLDKNNTTSNKNDNQAWIKISHLPFELSAMFKEELAKFLFNILENRNIEGMPNADISV